MKNAIPACCLCTLMLCACTRTAADKDTAAEAQVMPPVPARVESDAFALQAFRRLLAEQKGNVVFSTAGLEETRAPLPPGSPRKR